MAKFYSKIEARTPIHINMGIGSLLKYYIVAVLSIALNSVPSAIASMSCALIAEGKINIPKLAEAESFYQEIDTIWRHYPEGIHSGDERTRLANHLVTLAEDYLQASGVQYEKLPNGQGLLISGVQSKTIGPNWNRIAAEKKVTFIYHPAYLLYNVDLATGPVLSHEIEWVPITHLDLLLGPRSELVQRLLKLHLFGHKNHSALGPIYGEIYAQHPKTLEFARALSHHLDPLLFTKDWGSLHLENVSTNLLNAAEPHLNAHGVQVERLHQPDRIRIVPNIGGHQLNQLAYRIGAQLHYPVNFYYDPMQNLGPGIDASHISSASKRVEGRYSEVFLDEREILYLKRFYGFVIDTAEDARWAQLHVLLNNYRYRQSGLYAPYSLGEPIFVKVARDGSYLKSLSKSSAVREWNLAEPFMTGIIQVKTTRKDWLKVAIDEFIESMSGNTIYPVGSAVQFGNDRSVVLLNLGATKGHSVPYPPHYLKTALVSYLEHLKIIYKSKLGISNERFKKLADISINAEKRSHLLGVVKNTWIDERGKTKLDPSVKLSQLSEIYQKNAQEFWG
ncbi:MAG: hypothetical protein EOP04_08835 [Proteobacteria bacterium]|nr:MAG: hypothetical protein EOP04_08835 [Pseudomonadota bacterium]